MHSPIYLLVFLYIRIYLHILSFAFPDHLIDNFVIFLHIVLFCFFFVCLCIPIFLKTYFGGPAINWRRGLEAFSTHSYESLCISDCFNMDSQTFLLFAILFHFVSILFCSNQFNLVLLFQGPEICRKLVVGRLLTYSCAFLCALI